jgi:hypothetical protein
MAKRLPGGALSGKVGDLVYQRNGVVRAYVVPKDTKTYKQQRCRRYLAQIARAWGKLSPQERAKWVQKAYFLNNGLSGFHLWVSCAYGASTAHIRRKHGASTAQTSRGDQAEIK